MTTGSPATAPARRRLQYPDAVRRGPFVFVSGQTATDWEQALAPEATLPHTGNSARKEIGYVYDGLLAAAAEHGAELGDVIRIDSFYAGPRIQAGHFAARDDRWGADPLKKFSSIGVEVRRFLPTGTRMLMDLIAALPVGDTRCEPIWVEELGGSPIGIPMGVSYGDLVFLSGRMANDPVTKSWPLERTGVQIWHDYPPHVVPETRRLLEVLDTMLRGAGSDLQHVVKAQVYLTSAEDVTYVDEVWREVFPVDPPARNIVIADELAIAQARIEIAVVAVRTGGSLERRVIAAPDGLATGLHESAAVTAGPLLFLSGRSATDEHGALHPSARPNPDFPFNVSQGRAEMEVILDAVQKICEAAGGSLRDVVRVQSQFGDLAQFDGAQTAWGAAFGDDLPAWTVVETGGLVVRDSTVTCDVIAYLGDDA